MVATLQRLGYAGSTVSLRQDVLQGLVSPSQPSYDLSGRGRAARWSHDAVRRQLYIARLRRLGVDGRSLPLLAFVRDGWGWRNIAPLVAKAVERSAAIDRRTIRADSITDLAELIEHAAQPADEAKPAYTGPTLDARMYLLSTIAWGRPADGTSVVDALEGILAEVAAALGVQISTVEMEGGRRLGERVADARRRAGVSPSDLGDWILGLDDVAAERGRQWLHQLVTLFRALASKSSDPKRSTNPFSWCGEPLVHLRRELREEPGRPTVSGLLGVAIAQAIYAADLHRQAENQ